MREKEKDVKFVKASRLTDPNQLACTFFLNDHINVWYDIVLGPPSNYGHMAITTTDAFRNDTISIQRPAII